MNAGMKQMAILNKQDTSGSIRDLIVTTSIRILAIVQERFERINSYSYHMYDGRPQDCKNMRYLEICFVQINLILLSSRLERSL